MNIYNKNLKSSFKSNEKDFNEIKLESHLFNKKCRSSYDTSYKNHEQSIIVQNSDKKNEENHEELTIKLCNNSDIMQTVDYRNNWFNFECSCAYNNVHDLNQQNSNLQNHDQSYSVFPKNLDYNSMNIKNWHEEKTEEEVWRNQSNIISKETYDSFLNSKSSNYTTTNSESKENEEDIINTEGMRKEVRMKSVLRKIRRDIKDMFLQITSFDVTRKLNHTEYFAQCIYNFSFAFYGKNPSINEITVIGSMISAKSMQKALQYKKASEEINQEEYLKCIQISQQIHSTLYKYSERRLIKLSMNKEFKEVITKHAELCNTDNMNSVDKHFYSKIIQIFS